MDKELPPQEKGRKEYFQKRILMEQTLMDKMLRELPHKIPPQIGDVVFHVGHQEAFEVIKIEGGLAEVVPYSKLVENKTASMLNFKLSELWHEADFVPVIEEVMDLSDQEIAARISGTKKPAADLIN